MFKLFLPFIAMVFFLGWKGVREVSFLKSRLKLLSLKNPTSEVIKSKLFALSDKGLNQYKHSFPQR